MDTMKSGVNQPGHRPVVFEAEGINAILEKTPRIYLCGKLERSQPALASYGIDTEVGVSWYKEFTADAPHIHHTNREFNFIVEGCMDMLILETGEERRLGKGSLFVIEPGMPYATKSKAGTRVLFFKVPGGNDKELIDITPALKQWMGCWDCRWVDALRQAEDGQRRAR